MSAASLLLKNSTTLSIDTVQKNKYTALSGVWKYQIPRKFIEDVLNCESISQVCRANFKNNIVDKLKNGELSVKWCPIQGIGFGRYYSGLFQKGVSVGSLSSQIKHIKNTYYHSMGWTDFDFEKCHPSLIINIIEKSGIGIDCAALRKYITNFDMFADEMVSKLSADVSNPLSHSNIKDLINAHIYGGGFDAWADAIEAGDETKMKPPKPINRDASMRKTLLWYSKIHSCIKEFTNFVLTSNTQLKNLVHTAYPKKTNDEVCRTTISYYLQTFEHECLYQAYMICVKNGWIEKKKADLCYDGFTAKIIADIPIDVLLAKLNEQLAKKTGFNIRVVAKPFKNVIPELCFSPDILDTITAAVDTSILLKEYGLDLDEKGIADRFIEKFGNNICWALNGTAKRLYVYYIDKDTKIGRWYDETEKNDRLKLCLYMSENLYDYLIDDITNKMDEIISCVSNEQQKVVVRDRMLALKGDVGTLLRGKTTHRNDIMDYVRASCREVGDIFDKKPHLLGFNNGVIDLPTRTFREYRYDDYMTLTTGYDYKAVDYSIPRNDELRNILKKIWADIQPTEEQKILYIQSLASALDGRQYQKLFLFTGEGGNGKGLTNSLMKRVLGCGYAYDAPSAILKDFENKASNATPLLYNLKDKRYVVFTEVKGLISSAIIKKITGGDHVTARLLRENPTSFKLSSTMFMEFNAPPDLDGLPQEAEYRRLLYIDFPHNFTDDADKVGKTINNKTYLKADPYYGTDEFLEEMSPVFLDTLLHAYCYYYDETQKGMRFDIPQCVKERTDRFLQNQNPAKKWINTHYVICDIPKTERGAVAFEKCIKLKDLWRNFEQSEDYRGLCKEMKRQNGRDAFYKFINSNYECKMNKSYVEYALNITEKYKDWEVADNVEEDNDAEEEM
jgi:phage/plasmid-associated DNA primase